MTDDGAFRVVTAECTQTVAGVLAAQKVRGDTARHLADLVIGSILIRETMSPGLRVQGILKSERHGHLLGDSHPSGQSRGLVSSEAQKGFELTNSVLQMVRTLHDGRIQQGVVSVPEGGNVSSALMAYMQDSEQTTTMIVAETVIDDGKLVAAGGYLLQLLPGVDIGLLAIMTERLEDFRSLGEILRNPEMSPKALADELLYGIAYTELGQSELSYGCWCSRTNVLGALATLNRGEIQSMVDDGDVLEISCDYCTTDYNVTPAELLGLLDQN